MSTIKTKERASSSVPQQKTRKKASLLSRLIAFDRKAVSNNGEALLVGVDEVGRGCLAGPVVAAAVVLPVVKRASYLRRSLSTLNDSKQLPPDERERLSLVIREHAFWAIEESSVEEIDELNIVYASLNAMRRAVHRLLGTLSSSNILVLVDGHIKIPNLNCPQAVVVKGDGLSASIAAASVIAKVHRDSLMRTLASSIPAYDWHSNKGYGSRAHRQAIVTHGLTKWHRKAFVAKMMADLNQLKIDFEEPFHESFLEEAED